MSNDDIWNQCYSPMKLVNQESMKNKILTFLHVEMKGGFPDIISETGAITVDVVDNLHLLNHGRKTTPSGQFPKSLERTNFLRVFPNTTTFLTTERGMFGSTSLGSEIIEEIRSLLPSSRAIMHLIRSVVLHGNADNTRSPLVTVNLDGQDRLIWQQHRINIGNGGLSKNNDGSPFVLTGKDFLDDKIEEDSRFELSMIKKTVASLTEFTWRILDHMRNQWGETKYGPDSNRFRKYSEKLLDYIGMSEFPGSDCRTENITLIVTVLYPNHDGCNYHRDIQNDYTPGYTKTAITNMCFSNKEHSIILLFQVCNSMYCDVEVLVITTNQNFSIHNSQIALNFRRVIGDYLMPYRKAVTPVVNQVKEYLSKVSRSYCEIFDGCSSSPPTPFDFTNFYIDDTLINNKGEEFCLPTSNTTSVTRRYLRLPIGPDCILSASMFCDPIKRFHEYLDYEQLLELCLAASYLNNPLYFFEVLNIMMEKHKDPNNMYILSPHPFYDWIDETMRFSNDDLQWDCQHQRKNCHWHWQRSPGNSGRFSPSCDIRGVFGAHPAQTSEEEKDAGLVILKQTIECLQNFLEQIDGLSNIQINDPLVDLPMYFVMEIYNKTIIKLQSIVDSSNCGIQINQFRLSMFLVVAIGSGLLQNGQHLNQILIPVEGGGSKRHLETAGTNIISWDNARQGELKISQGGNKEIVIPSHFHDEAMSLISIGIGCKSYKRNFVECCLVSSTNSNACDKIMLSLLGITLCTKY